jgi:hypothetical protein
VPLVIGVVIVGITLYLLATGFEAEVYRLKLKGEPTTLEEFKQFCPPTGKPAIHYQKLADALQKVRDDLTPDEVEKFQTLPFVGESESCPRELDSWEELPLAEEYLALHAEVLQIVDQTVIENATLDYPSDWDEIISSSEYLPISRVTDVLLVLSLVSSLRNDSKEAIKSLEQVQLLASYPDYWPAAMSHLVREGIHRAHIKSVEFVVAIPGLTNDDLDRLRQMILARNNKGQLHRTFVSERIFLIDALRDPWNAPQGFFRCIAQRKYLMRSANAWAKLCKEDWSIVAARAPVLREADEAIYAESLFGNVFEVALDVTLWNEAQRELAQVGIASRHYLLSHGHSVRAIEDLVPRFLKRIPTSPFSGERARLTENDQGELIFDFKSPRRNEDGSIAELQPQFRYYVRPMDQTD